MLRKLNDDLQANARLLAAPGIDGDKYGSILPPLILSRYFVAFIARVAIICLVV